MGDGKATALLRGLAVLDLFGRDRTVVAAVGTDLRRAADGPLRDLAAQLGETAHCSSIGKALLAGLSPVELAARYPDPGLEARTPVTGRTGSVVASISISGPASRLRDTAVFATAADAVRATARQISARLGASETALCADAS